MSPVQVEVLYQDPFLAVVHKPTRVLTHPGFGDRTRAMVQRVRDQLGRRVYPVHRLDRPTSGVLVFGLDSRSAADLNRQFRASSVRKRYVAIVRGVPAEWGIVDHPVPDRWDGPRQSARTSLVRHFHDGRYSLVEAGPLTGRRHQIRRHLKHLSCPILGDVNYGDGGQNRRWRQRCGLWRLALHAYALDLDHPRTGLRLRFTAPLPDDLRRPLAAWSGLASSHLPDEARPRTLGASCPGRDRAP
jgi:tRNA pseudouridine65 synthase